MDFSDWVADANANKMPLHCVTGPGKGESLALTQTEHGCLFVSGEEGSILMDKEDFMGTARSRTGVTEQGVGEFCLYSFGDAETAAAFAKSFIKDFWSTTDVTVDKSYNEPSPPVDW